jgi:hypothetical protein
MRHADFNFALAKAEDIDSAKRMSEVINERLAWFPFLELMTKWMAFRLEDGSSDRIVYDSRAEAVRHQTNENLCCYFAFKNCPGGVQVRDAWLYMQFHRHAYSRGARLADPDDRNGGRDFILPVTRQGVAAQVSKLIVPRGFR